MALHPVAEIAWLIQQTFSRCHKRKRLPCVKGAGQQGLRDCRFPSKKHAETLWQMQIAILRVGCATGVRPRAGSGTPPTGCICIRGKQQKKALEEIYISIHAFFCFHCARSYIHFVSSINMRKHPCLIRLYVALWVQGQCPWCGVQGARSPLSR